MIQTDYLAEGRMASFLQMAGFVQLVQGNND